MPTTYKVGDLIYVPPARESGAPNILMIWTLERQMFEVVEVRQWGVLIRDSGWLGECQLVNSWIRLVTWDPWNT